MRGKKENNKMSSWLKPQKSTVFTLLICVILIISSISIVSFGNDSDQRNANNTTDSAVTEDTGNDEDIISEPAIEENDNTNNNNKQQTKKKDTNSIKPQSDPDEDESNDDNTFEVTVDNTVITSAAMDTKISGWNYAQTKTFSIYIKQNSEDEKIGGKYVEINIPEGLEYYSYSKDNISNFAEIITPPKQTNVNGVKSTYGKLLYKIKDETTELNIQVVVQPDMKRYYGEHQVAEAIDINLLDSSKKIEEKVDIKAGLVGNIVYRVISEAKNVFTKFDKNATTRELYPRLEKDGSYVNMYSDQWSITYTYPKEAELVDVVFPSFKPNDMPDKTFNGHSGVEHDAANNQVTLYYKNKTLEQKAQLVLKFTEAKGAKSNVEYRPSKAVINYKGYDGSNAGPINITTVGSSRIIISDDSESSLNLQSTNWKLSPTPELNGTPIEGLSIVNLARFANRTGDEIEDQIIEYTFSPKLNVRGFDLPVEHNTKQEVVIEYKTSENSSPKQYKQELTANKYGRVTITPEMLGLNDGEILTYIKAEVGNFSESYTQGSNTSEGCGIYGNLYIKDQGASDLGIQYKISQKEGSNVAEGTMTSVPTKASQRPVMKGMLTNNNNSTSYTAGSQIQISGILDTYGGLYTLPIQRILNPVLYIVVPEGFSLNYSDIQLKSGSQNVEFNATKKLINGQTVIEVAPKKVVVGKVQDGSLSNFSKFEYFFKYNTRETIKTQTWKLNNLVFFGPDIASTSEMSDVTFGGTADAGAAVYVKQDTNDFNSNGNAKDYLATVDGTSGFTVYNKNDIMISAAIKATDEDNSMYRTYDGNEDSMVVFTAKKKADYKLRIINNYQSSAESFEAYIPVPKKDKNYGADYQQEAFKWSMKLKKGITVTSEKDKNIKKDFTIEYGIPSGGTYRNYVSENNTTSWSEADWAKVEMIRIKCDTVSKDNDIEIDLVYDLDLGPDDDVSDLNGKDNVFRTYFKAVTDGKNGKWYHGEYVAAKLKSATIEGFVFVDENKNGEKGAGEDNYSKPVKVTIISHPAGYNGEMTTMTGQDGKYAFTEVIDGNYSLQFELPNGYVFTKKNAVSDIRIDSDVDKTGKTDVFPVPTNSARYLGAGISKNDPPKIEVKNVTLNANGSFSPSVVSITDDFDGTIKFNKTQHVKSNGVPSTLAAGTYKVVYTATDSHGATSEAEQVVKVNGLPYLVTAPAMIKSANDAPGQQILADNVSIKKDIASDTVGQKPTSANVDAAVTMPNYNADNIGIYDVNYTEGTNVVKGSFPLYLYGKPVVTATVNSGDKTNKDIQLTASKVDALTVQHSKDGGKTWEDGNTLTISTDDRLKGDFKFRYKEFANLGIGDKDIEAIYQADINKIPPGLKNMHDLSVTDGDRYYDQMSFYPVPHVDKDDVSVRYKQSGADDWETYNKNSMLFLGQYDFQLTDGYGNSSSLSVTIVPTIYTLTFDDDGADIEVVSPNSIDLVKPNTILNQLPEEPQKTDNDFDGWYTQKDGKGIKVDIGTAVNRSMTVYAKWKSVDETNVITNDTDDSTTDSINGGNKPEINTPQIMGIKQPPTISGNETPLTTPDDVAYTLSREGRQEAAAKVAEREGIPVVDIGDTQTPLMGSKFFESWSLINLLFTIIGIGVTLGMFIARLKSKDEHNRKRWFFVTIGLSLIGLIIFMMTQDMTKAMVLTDSLTIAHMILVVLGIYGAVRSLKDDEEDEPVEENMA